MKRGRGRSRSHPPPADPQGVTADVMLLDVLRGRARRDLEHAAAPAVLLDGGTSCGEVARIFDARRDLTSVVVRDAETRDTGLVARKDFELLMGGRFRLGRSAHQRRSIAEVAHWGVDVLPAGSDITRAAGAALSRSTDRRFDDLVLEGRDGTLLLLPAPAVLEALAAGYVERATHDQLTGLANRELLFSRLSAALRAVDARSGDAVAVTYVDLDGFKPVNDRYGHDAGDAVIREVAAVLRSTVRPGDVVARVGGDEFAVLTVLPGARAAAAEGAASTAHRLSAAVGGILGGGDVPVSASIGVAVALAVPGALPVDADALFRLADAAMYTAKRRGDGQVEVVRYTAEQVRDVTAAVRGGQLVLHYQPVVTLPAGVVVGHEALVRWQHPRDGLIGPAAFLDAAEREGAMPLLDAWVLDRVCADLAAADRAGAVVPGRVNVNVSRDSLRSDVVAAMVTAALERHGVAGSRIALEVSEAASIAEVGSAAASLQVLRLRGVTVVLDDAGAGHTSLNHLTTLGLDGFKLDRALVVDAVTSPASAAMVRVLADLGRRLGLPVTAEGVETAEQARVLADLDVPLAQGYLYGRPGPWGERRR